MLDGREFQDRTKTLQSSQSLASVGPVSMRNSFRLESGTSLLNESRVTVNSRGILFLDKNIYFSLHDHVSEIDSEPAVMYLDSTENTSETMYLEKSHVHRIHLEI